jgi:hypothetical protein
VSQLSDKFTEFQEEVARERYPDCVKESHGLFRAMMQVFVKPEDREEVIRRLKEWEKNTLPVKKF